MKHSPRYQSQACAREASGSLDLHPIAAVVMSVFAVLERPRGPHAQLGRRDV
ncbi:hypothetical protein [Paraburkholderia sp.]|uniref:hypothetical protein n=1 Tax=Paraburkholderia sp. TaxID=1926495 RepID=UPI003C7EBF8A